MPTDARENPLVLPILGLLVEQPRHAYAVFAELRGRYDYLRVRNATVYTLLDTLADVGWVESLDYGDRPTLATTQTGRVAFAGKVASQIRHASPTGGPAFVTALAYLSILPPAEAGHALRDRLKEVRDEQRRLEQSIQDAGLPDVQMIEVHYLVSRLGHDAQWLEQTTERVATGHLAWPRQH